MDYQAYHAQAKANFPHTQQVNINGSDTLVSYDEVFKWSWFATKLKIFSFLTYVEKIDETTMKQYTQNCLRYACSNKKGLPRGFQNGVVSYAVLASEQIDPAAIDFVTKRPAKHYSAFEMPIIADLSKKELYFYRDNIIWGCLYDSFLKEYLLRHFDISQ